MALAVSRSRARWDRRSRRRRAGEGQDAVDACAINLCTVTSWGPRCGKCKFDEDPKSYMRDDTECEKCTGREGPAIIAASILVPVVIVGAPLIAFRIEHTRAVAYKFYNRFIDIGKFKVSALVSVCRAVTSHGAHTGRLRQLRHYVLNQLE